MAGTPAPDSRLLEGSHAAGRLAVEMVAADRRPSEVFTRGSFLNAIVALAAVGGSTNAVVHLLAIAGRLGVELTQDDFDRTGADVPLLVNLQPAGTFLMEDFHRAGGLLAVLRQVEDLLDPDAITVTGRPLVELRRRGRDLGPRGHPPTRRAVPAARRHRRAARQPGADRCGDQAGRSDTRVAPAPRTQPWSSTRSRTCTPASTIRTWTWMPTPCSCSGGAARAATPACPRWPTCRCRRSCSRPASATWCGSATAG